jgi:hypothetical protein
MPKIGQSVNRVRKPEPQQNQSDQVPAHLRPYIAHGLNLQYRPGDAEAVCECPFCGREQKFSVNISTGQWQCFVCGSGTTKGGGNIYTFIRLLHSESETATKDYAELTGERCLEYSDTLVHWGICKSTLSGNWMVPAYDLDAKGNRVIKQLYQYVQNSERRYLLPTPELGHGLFGVNLYDNSKPIVYLCEGPWDALRLWEVLRTTKITNQVLVPTASADASLYADANILAVPACKVFFDNWIRWFRDKQVYLCYDNDYPKQHPTRNQMTPPAGFVNMKRISGFLSRIADVYYLNWGQDGYDPELPDGFDIRDALSTNYTALGSDTLQCLHSVLDRIHSVPEEWKTVVDVSPNGESIEPKPCSSYDELIDAWGRAMKWTGGLDHGLTVMLACVASTMSIGDQLWARIIGPAASGKTTLCEAVSTNKKYTVAKSTVRGFHSGYKIDESGADHSLVSILGGKTLITKDGDTLLQAPNLAQILSEARDIYDGTSRTHYRNSVSREYDNIRMTWILCGTNSLRQLDTSELGERFIDCVVMDKIDLNLEDEICWLVADQADRGLGYEAGGDSGRSQHSPERIEAYALTGGYVGWLREHAASVLPTIAFPDEHKRYCVHLGKFVAYMRARPSARQAEMAERELASRLVAQHVRLAKCLAFVCNREAVDAEIMSRVRQVSLDTARGQTLDIVRVLYRDGEQGRGLRSIAIICNKSEDSQYGLMRFLMAIDVIQPLGTSYNMSSIKWRLAEHMRQLFQEVMGEDAYA